MWTRYFLTLWLILGAGVSFAHADGYVETSGTYTEGEPIRGNRYNTSGELKTTIPRIGGEHIDSSVEENGYIRVQPRAGTVGGASYSSRISVGTTEDEHAVCTAACTLYSIAATNTNAAVRYLKCFDNVAASTTPGTSTPILRMAVPGAATGGGFTITYPVGVSFATGLTCWLVTGAADSDVAEVAANELMVNYSYKQ